MGSQVLTPGQAGFGQCIAFVDEAAQCRSQVSSFAIPGSKEVMCDSGVIRIHARTVAIKESGELGEMNLFVLCVDLPDEGLARPLSTHEGVFTAHKIDVALPKQAVIGIERQEGNCLDAYLAVLPGRRSAQMPGDGLQGFAGRHMDHRNLRQDGEGIEQHANRCGVIAK